MSVENSFAGKVSFVFNKVVLNLVKELRRVQNDTFKKQLKADYGTFDKFSSEYLSEFEAEVAKHDQVQIRSLLTQRYDVDALRASELIASFKILRNTSIGDILTTVDELEHSAFFCYLYTLYFIHSLKQESKHDTADVTVLNELLLMCVKINAKVRVDLKDDMESSHKQLLNNMITCNRDSTSIVQTLEVSDLIDDEEDPPSQDPMNNMMNSAMEFLHSSKLGELAKEIAEDVDLSKINVGSQEKLFDIDAMFSGEGNSIGDLIGTVGKKITSKIQSGEIDQSVLMNEALQMMGKMKMNNPLFDNMMSSMMGTGGASAANNNPDFSEMLKQVKGANRLNR
jgi:hypothetical protein